MTLPHTPAVARLVLAWDEYIGWGEDNAEFNQSFDDFFMADGAEDIDPFLLVETNTRNGGHFLTTHKTLDDAGNYHAGQEYPDWDITALIDLTTGKRYVVSDVKITFREEDTG